MTKRIVALHIVALLVLSCAPGVKASDLLSESPAGDAARVEDSLTSVASPVATVSAGAMGGATAIQPSAISQTIPQALQNLNDQVQNLGPADGSLTGKAQLDSFIENGSASGRAAAVAVPASAATGASASANAVVDEPLIDSDAPPAPAQDTAKGSSGLFAGIKASASRILNSFFGKQNPPAPGSDDGQKAEPERLWITVRAQTPAELTRLAELGLDAEGASAGEGMVSGSVAQSSIAKIKAAGFEVVKTQSLQLFAPTDFPKKDAVYHNYDRMVTDMKAIAAAHPDTISMFSIGKSVEGRDLWALRFNSNAKGNAPSSKPGFALFGAHHAREHLSVEVPLKIAQYLASTTNADDLKMLAERDVYIIPMVNPDGAEFDIQGPKQNGSYQMWRKNRRNNGDGTYGVDLNRNYGYEWGTGGASPDTDDETYRGPGPFSEPETQAVRDFLTSHTNIKILDTKHSFSELHLYPDGYKYTPIENKQDADIHKALAEKMADFTGYTPEQSSKLYIASGDLTDWSYHQLGIYSFTTELTPSSEWGGGFYPGTKVIEKAYESNLQADLMLIRYADDPSRVLKPGI